MLSGDHSCALSDSLWGDVELGCQKLLRAGLFLRMHLKKFYPKPMLQDPGLWRLEWKWESCVLEYLDALR